ncbi:Ribosomal protein S1 [Comamonas testosteroni]|nr:tape measure protein [Comamonas testosteroni]KWT64776.1 Ribosomal protein S1 [Comamonas testosteroni]
MAEKVGEIYYDVTLETQDLLNKNKAVNNELNKTKANLDSLDAQLKKTAAAAKALFAGLGVLAIIDKADQWGQYASRIRQATKSTEEYTLVQDRMLQSANQTFRSINETRESFIQLSPVLREMGLTLGQSLDAIDAFSGLLVTNAASADKAKGAQDAFSKSLQKGKIDADAWMSIYSTLDSVVDLIATSSGKTGEEIRRMGAEGKLSIDVFVKALVEGNAKVMTQVKEMPTTFRDALQNLNNGFTEFIGKNNEAYGVTATLVKGVALLGENFELLANAGLVAVAAGLARYTLGATASAAATAYKALTAVSAAAAEVRLAEAEVATTTAAIAQASAFRGVGVTTAQLTVATNAQQAALLNLAKAQAAQVAAQTAASSAVRTGLALLGGPAGIAIAAGLAATAWFSYRDATKAAQSSVVDMKQPLDEVIKKFQELNSLQRQQQLTSLGKQYQEDMTTAKTAVHDFMDGFRAAMGQGGTEAAKFRATFRQEVTALTSDATMSSDELAQALSDLIDRWSKASRFQFDWYGPWDKVIGKFAVKRGEKGEYRVPGWTFADEEGCGVRVWATLKGEENPRTLELLLAQARTRNSTLWADDPKQQLAYLAQKRWARLFAPDVILGVYSADELQEPQEIHMGDAVVVEPERATLAAWTDDKWAKQLPSILKGIQGGKTVADALAWLGAKGIVTAEQEKELRTKAKELTQPAATPASAPQEGAPVVDPARLEADIKACTDLEKLYELGSLIEAVAEPSLQATLTDQFDARVAELEKP